MSKVGSLVPVSSVLHVIERTVILVGNASKYISRCKSDNVISKMEFRNKALATVKVSVRNVSQKDICFWLSHTQSSNRKSRDCFSS